MSLVTEVLARRSARAWCAPARLLAATLFIILMTQAGMAQGGVLWGDFKVDEGKTGALKPGTFNVILYDLSGRVVSRQVVTNNGRYRFFNLSRGEYDLVVEVENQEVVRMHVQVPARDDTRHDIFLEWRENTSPAKGAKAATVAAEDLYTRTPASKGLFEKSAAAIKREDYDQAVSLLRQIVSADAKDFEAWTELGTLLSRQKKDEEAERAYLRALEAHPTFLLALLNLGRLRLSEKNYDGAVEVLTRAVEARPLTAEAHLLLGESYLQLKRGSKAVSYLNEAARLGRPEAHLRLALLYDRAGMKDKAADEYEQFIAKQPDYPDKKKLQQYIAENKKK